VQAPLKILGLIGGGFLALDQVEVGEKPATVELY
tara:strand:- start:473 stop:574 length:102 start_codon:yes stop_codon:yes gene_type:complete